MGPATSTVKELPYTSDTTNKLLALDLYLPPSISSPTQSPSIIVFVHGGAWRAGDKSQHAALAQHLASSTLCAVAVPNYRLSPAVKHPVHTDDIQDALIYLREQYHRLIHLIGHSAGAHIISTLLLSGPSSIRNPTPDDLIKGIESATLVEGIYNLDLLLTSFPSDFYRGFVQQGFGAKPEYSDADLTTYELHPAGEHIRWLVLHSPGDTLVDVVQAEKMVEHLREICKGERVKEDFTTLTGEHDQLLDSTQLIELVSSMMA